MCAAAPQATDQVLSGAARVDAPAAQGEEGMRIFVLSPQLPFKFPAPRLEWSKDKKTQRLRWEREGKVVENHKHHMVSSVGKRSRTVLL